jgi:carboxyl-terminal processing protease
MVAASNAELSGVSNYVGIGVLVEPMIEKAKVIVLQVSPDSAAEHAGLNPHDSILAVDGHPIVENGQSHSERIRGPECSTLVLKVQSPGGKPREVTLVRYKITTPPQVDIRRVTTKDGSRIGYMMIPTFFDNTVPAQVRMGLEFLGQLDGLIIDNRMNTGGSSDVLDPVLSYFTGGTLGQFVSRTTQRPFVVQPAGVGDSQTVPMVVLVGKGTVSFGEIFAGILQDEGRAKIVGESSSGNVETLHGYSFEDGSTVWIAEERFVSEHSRASWEGKGVEPDVKAYADWDTFTFESDPAVAASLRIFGHE